MSNYFQNREKLDIEMDALRRQLRELRIENEAAHKEYLRQIRDIMVTNPNMTAAQIAAIMTEDKKERASVKASVAGLGYASEDSRRKNPDVKNPTMPEIKRGYREVTRRFIEVDDNGMVIGSFTKEEWRHTYSIEV